MPYRTNKMFLRNTVIKDVGIVQFSLLYIEILSLPNFYKYYVGPVDGKLIKHKQDCQFSLWIFISVFWKAKLCQRPFKGLEISFLQFIWFIESCTHRVPDTVAANKIALKMTHSFLRSILFCIALREDMTC